MGLNGMLRNNTGSEWRSAMILETIVCEYRIRRDGPIRFDFYPEGGMALAQEIARRNPASLRLL